MPACNHFRVPHFPLATNNNHVMNKSWGEELKVNHTASDLTRKGKKLTRSRNTGKEKKRVYVLRAHRASIHLRTKDDTPFWNITKLPGEYQLEIAVTWQADFREEL